jgi:LacI family transcriptional regulator
MDKKKITVKELAKKLGVSISTVSKALNDSHEISEETKRRVQKLAERYHYKPNRLAVNLKSGSTRTIGVILPSILSNFFTAVLCGIEEVTNEENYNIITCFSNESFDREVTNTDILSNGIIDGLIVAISEETQIRKDYDHFRQCLEKGTPVVMFDRVTSAIECDKVVVDDYNDAYLATGHLIGCGCKHLALVSAIDFLSVGKNRVKGFVAAVEEKLGNLPGDMLIRCSTDELEQNVEALLSEKKVDGLFAVDEDASLAIWKVCRELGLVIPGQVSVIGYAGEKLARNLNPALTTVNQNGVEIGRESARILLDRLRRDPGGCTTKVINTTIEKRVSTQRKKFLKSFSQEER